MNDAAWCRGSVDAHTNELQELAQCVRRATKNRDEIAAIWTDNAGRDLFSRLIHPFAADTSQALNGFEDHCQSLHTATDQMTNGESPALEIGEISQDSYRNRQRLDSELKSVHRSVDAALDQAAHAREYIAEARRLIGLLPR